MDRERLLFGVAAVFAGIATLEFILGFVYTPALFVVAVPFAVASYLVWYHASGRLRARVERGGARTERRAQADSGGFGAGPRESYSNRRGGFGESSARREAKRRVRQNSGPSPREAYRILGLDADADSGAVQQAYRERVKEVHPDRADGDEDEFKRVQAAYEVLSERE